CVEATNGSARWRPLRPQPAAPGGCARTVRAHTSSRHCLGIDHSFRKTQGRLPLETSGRVGGTEDYGCQLQIRHDRPVMTTMPAWSWGCQRFLRTVAL